MFCACVCVCVCVCVCMHACVCVCMCVLVQFIAGTTMEMETVYAAIRPLLQLLGDHRSLSLNIIQRLSSLVQLFPTAFNEKLCDQLQVCTGTLTN